MNQYDEYLKDLERFNAFAKKRKATQAGAFFLWLGLGSAIFFLFRNL